MDLDERLTEVFDRGLRKGVDTLSPVDRELYLIQDFIIEYEMGGLSTYFYNRLPDLDLIQSAIAAMRRHGVIELANLLADATDLFRKYAELDVAATWGDVLRQCDPNGRLDAISDRIMALKGYWLDESAIT